MTLKLTIESMHKDSLNEILLLPPPPPPLQYHDYFRVLQMVSPDHFQYENLDDSHESAILNHKIYIWQVIFFLLHILVKLNAFE